jgi:hypothetical protein
MKGLNCYLNGVPIGGLGMQERGKVAILLSAEIGENGELTEFKLTASGYATDQREHREWINIEFASFSKLDVIFETVDVSNNTTIIDLPSEYHPPPK